ncbi:hypothetical protein SDC9_124175 [bioreactor metagenome]|uniref:Uncharacterized protein n=1 Tax=bioreactor metagenome TaxID=1076179 RepID=A0A645CJQ7_9ZZZZ
MRHLHRPFDDGLAGHLGLDRHAGLMVVLCNSDMSKYLFPVGESNGGDGEFGLDDLCSLQGLLFIVAHAEEGQGGTGNFQNFLGLPGSYLLLFPQKGFTDGDEHADAQGVACYHGDADK